MKQTEEDIIKQIRIRLKDEFVPLFFENGKPAGAGYSKSTRHIYKDIDALINDHYGCHTTEEEKEQLYNIRKAAFDEKERKKEATQFEKATKIKYSAWKGEQFFDGENYQIELSDLIESLDGDPENWPTYVWATKEVPYIKDKEAWEVYSSDIEDELDSEYDWPVDGKEQLQKALDEFVEANKTNIAYHADYTIALLIEDEIEEYRKTMEE